MNIITYLPKFSTMQRDLDTYIEKQHPVQAGERRNMKKANALNCELAELMNETRVQKFWSTKGPSEREIVLEEYVDGIHFIVSIGNDRKVDFENINLPTIRKEDINELFNDTFQLVSFLAYGFDLYEHTLAMILKIGEKLGFTAEDIEQAYIAKWEKNHKRQESGVY